MNKRNKKHLKNVHKIETFLKNLIKENKERKRNIPVEG